MRETKKGRTRKEGEKGEDILLFYPGEDPHRHTCTGLLDKFDEPLVVVTLVKHILPRVAAVQNVVANPSDGSSCGSWHSAMLPQKPVRKPANSDKKEECPPFPAVPFSTKANVLNKSEDQVRSYWYEQGGVVLLFRSYSPRKRRVDNQGVLVHEN